MFLDKNSSTIYCMRWADLAQGWYFWYSYLWGTTSLGRRIRFSEKPNAPAQARAQHKSSMAMLLKFPSFMAHFQDYSTIYTRVSTHQHTFLLFFAACRQLIFFIYILRCNHGLLGTVHMCICNHFQACKAAMPTKPDRLLKEGKVVFSVEQ